MKQLNSPLVSIIIPCYNQGQYLEETVDSVLAQTYNEIEIIIVNDGSTDSYTNKLLENYQRSKVRVITTKNQGLAEARNTAIAEAEGIYILPLDADDRVAATYCQRAVDIISKDTTVGIVHGETEYFGERAGLRYDPPFSLRAMLQRNIILCSSLFRREDWERVGGYNANMKHGGEDWDFWLSIIELGKEVVKIPEVMFYYRIRSGSMARSIDQEKFRILRRQIVKNHAQLYADHFPDPITLYWEGQQYRAEYEKINASKEYKLAKMALAPIKNLLKSWS